MKINPYRHIEAERDGEALVLTILLEKVNEYMLAEELRFELVHAVKTARAQKIVLDLKNMTFMTSLACLSFIGVKHAAREVEGRLVLCNMSEFIRKILHTKRLLSPSQGRNAAAFESAEDLEHALAGMQE